VYLNLIIFLHYFWGLRFNQRFLIFFLTLSVAILPPSRMKISGGKPYFEERSDDDVVVLELELVLDVVAATLCACFSTQVSQKF